MKHSTNYTNTLILPSDDCKAVAKTPEKPVTVAGLQFAMMQDHALTSDDLLVAVTAHRRDIPADEHDALRGEIFSKGQPCLRASPLVKTHGWAVYHDKDAVVFLVDPTSQRYADLMADDAIAKVKGMKSRR
mgnify:FL=1